VWIGDDVKERGTYRGRCCVGPGKALCSVSVYDMEFSKAYIHLKNKFCLSFSLCEAVTKKRTKHIFSDFLFWTKSF
jgi:hypothetical protein